MNEVGQGRVGSDRNTATTISTLFKSYINKKHAWKMNFPKAIKSE